jgi:hypothetical protein
MKDYGGAASKAKIRVWEAKIEKLRRGAVNGAEQRAEAGWYGDKGGSQEVKGMNMKWVFEKAWRDTIVDEAEAVVEGASSPGEGRDVVKVEVVVRKGKTNVGRGVGGKRGRKRGADTVEEDHGGMKTRGVGKRRKLEAGGAVGKRAKRA